MAATLTLLNAVVATGADKTYPIADHDAALGIQITGTFVGTVTFQASADGGTTYVSVQARNVADGTIATTTTAAGIFMIPCAGFTHVRPNVTAYTSGTITARAKASSAPPLW